MSNYLKLFKRQSNIIKRGKSFAITFELITNESGTCIRRGESESSNLNDTAHKERNASTTNVYCKGVKIDKSKHVDALSKNTDRQIRDGI